MVLGSSRRPTLVGLVVWFVLISGYVQAQSPPQKSPQDSRPSTSMAIDDGESHVTLGALPKNLLEDQEAFWTSPFRMRTGNLSFLVPATFASAFLVGSDTAAETHLPKATATVSRAATASNAGMAALLGAGGGLFLWGQIHQNEHQHDEHDQQPAPPHGPSLPP